MLLSRCVAFDPTAAHLADPACRRLDDLALLPGGQLAAHLHVYMHEFAAAALAGTHAARVCAAAAAAVADVAAAAENGIPPPPNTQPQAPLLLLPPPLLFTAIEHAVLTASVMSVRLNTYVDSGARLADTAHSCCRYGAVSATPLTLPTNSVVQLPGVALIVNTLHTYASYSTIKLLY